MHVIIGTIKRTDLKQVVNVGAGVVRAGLTAAGWVDGAVVVPEAVGGVCIAW